MATVIMDLVKAVGVWEPLGYRFTRYARVLGVTGTAAERLTNAIDAILGEIGSSSSYPGVSDCSLRSINVTGDNGIDIDATIEYDTKATDTEKYFRNNPVYTFSSGLAQVETNKDRDGTKHTLSFPLYVGPESSQGDEYGYDINYRDIVTATVNVDVAEKQLLVSQKQTYTITQMNAIWDTYGNTLNNADWIATGDKGLWKLTGLNADPNEDGTEYDVTFIFTFREIGWEETLYYKKADGQAPGQELIDEYGPTTFAHCTVEDTTFKKYRETTFTNLFNP